MKENIPETVQEVHEVKHHEKQALRNYPKIWLNIEPERVMNKYEYGSKNITKMVMFLLKVKPTQEEIDHWCNYELYPVYRKEDESYENYKIRQCFRNHLENYRKEVRAIIIQEKIREQIQKLETKQKEENGK